ILDFSISESKGVITSSDGKRYYFAAQEWKEQAAPVKGQTVDFDIDEAGNAVGVYNALGSPAPISASQSSSAKSGTKPRAAYNALDWYVLAIKNYVNFSGRAERREFWFFVLMHIAGSFLLGILDGLIFGANNLSLFSSLFILFNMIPGISISVRRLHDIGKSGWWLLLSLIPLLGAILLIVWFIKPGDSEPNGYGANVVSA